MFLPHLSLSTKCPVVCPKVQCLDHFYFLIYVYDFHNCSTILDFHLFADDANLSFQHRDINMLESLINSELEKVFIWLCANKLSSNTDKSNFVIFCPRYSKKFAQTGPFSINNHMLTLETSIRYLGVYID